MLQLLSLISMVTPYQCEKGFRMLTVKETDSVIIVV